MRRGPAPRARPLPFCTLHSTFYSACASAVVLLNRQAVVHLVHSQDLRLAAVAAELVVLAHDQRLHRLGGAHLRTEPAEAAPREVEIEVVQRLQLLSRFAMPPERDQVVGTRLGALVAHDAGLGPGA